MIIIYRPRFSLLTLLVLCLYGCANQQLQLGVEQFNAGNYDLAASHWNPLAKSGNPYAQYNLGLLWEEGLGSTPKNISMAWEWYLSSAKQGYVPAMVRLANIQRAMGHEEAAHSWYVLAARWGDQGAITALSEWGKTIPDPDLLQQKRAQDEQKRAQDATAQQAADAALGSAAYSLGCALSGGSCSGTTSSTYRNTDKSTADPYLTPSNRNMLKNTTSYGRDNKIYRYEGPSGQRYQYDLSNPLDEILYEVDPAAQLRDEINPSPMIELDRGLGRAGGGAQW